MTEHEAFLAAIREHPDDDAPREMYADWLTERGDPRGEFIRVQLELEKFPDADAVRAGEYDTTDGINEDWKRAIAAVDRERELLRGSDAYFLFPSHVAAWIAGIPGQVPVLDNREPVVTIGKSDSILGPPKRLVFRRGFVDEIHLETEDFLDYAKAIFVSQPVTKVVLTDRVPTQRIPRANDKLEMKSGQYRWYVTISSDCSLTTSHWISRKLSPEYAGESKVFDTADLAHAWLSDLCVTRGREWAGLPPLKKENQS